VLGKGREIRLAAAADAELDELPVPFVTSGAKDTAILGVVGIEKPVLQPLTTVLASHVAMDAIAPLLSRSTERGHYRLRVIAFIAVIAKHRSVTLEEPG
jgi:hypothetical protein